MRNDDDSVGCYIDTTRAWMTGRMRSRMPAGQSGVETFQRFEAVVREAAASTPSASIRSRFALLNRRQ